MRALSPISLIVCAIVALATTPARAELFYCKDGSGKRVIQNMPCDGDTRATEPVQRPRANAFGDAVAAYQRGDYVQAVSLWRPLAEAGDARAQSVLGLLYTMGLGVKQDDQEAVKWYRLAAAQGLAAAQNNLGVSYRDGSGVAQNPREAAKWFRLAAVQGNAQAKNNLDALYKKAQLGRDPIAVSAPRSQVAPPLVANQPAPDPLAPPRAGSRTTSYVDRAFAGAVIGAVGGAIFGIFIHVRAFVRKVKAPTAAAAMALYLARPQVMKIGALLLLGAAALLVYFLFFKTNTVDYYLNDYQVRIEKLQDCGRLPDMTKDRECMNAYTAQRMFMLR